MTLSSLTTSMLLGYGSTSGSYGIDPLALSLALASASSSSTSQTTTSPTQQAIAAAEADISGLDQLSSAVSGFRTTMDTMLTAAQAAPASASSSDTTVASASALSTAAAGTYNVTVNALAQSQTVTSADVADPAATVIGSGTLTIQLGTYDSGTNSFTAGSSSPVSINVTNGSLDDIATAINNAGAGVTASVVQDSGGYHLTLTSDSTGAANGFSVSVTDGDGTNTDTSGLSQLAYDPTAAAGAGKNLTQTQAAQDASLTVNGAAQTSASNTGVSIATGVSAQLLTTGSTTVSVAPDTSALESAAQDFVTAYNSLVDTIGGLTGTSGALAGDALAQQLQNQLARAATDGSYAAGSLSGLAQIGITAQTDGHLALDTTALQTAYTGDTASTASVLSQAAQAMDTLAGDYVDPGGFVPLDQNLLQDNLFQLQLVDGFAPTSTSTSTSSTQTLIDQYQAYQAALNLQTTSSLLAQSLQSSSTSLFG